MSKKNMKKVVCLLLMFILAVSTLFGCSKKSTSKETSENDTTASTPAAVDSTQVTPAGTAATSPDTITAETNDHVDVLKVPNYDWVRIADKNGWFAKAFPNTKIQIVEGVTGKEIQLFERGELYFANRMLYPTLLYAKEGADFKIISVSQHPETPIGSVIVKADSPYKTFADLKGKKIASWRASCPYMILIELASQQGWKEGTDWNFVNVPSTDLKTALLAGEVDAIVFHANGDFAQLLVSGEGREIAQPAKDSVYIQGGGIVDDFSPTSFVEKHSGIVKKYLELKTLTNAWMYENEDKASSIIESITRVPADVSKEWWDRSKSTTLSSTLTLPEIKEEILKTEDWLVEDGDIKDSERVDWDNYFANDYFKIN